MTKSKNWTKFPTLFSLYIAQSVPMSFFSTVVPVIMREENYSLESIGYIQLIRLPWLIKFLWAPLIDNTSRNSGDLKRWIILSEIFYAVVIISIGFLNLQTDFRLIVVLMVLAITASATQDIATDAFAILILKKEERGLGNSLQSAGSFFGAIIGTGVLLIAYSYFGWMIFLFMLAAFVLFAIVPLRLYKQKHIIEKKSDYRLSYREMGKFFKMPGMSGRVLVLIFYYSGFMGLLTMLKPYLVDLGYNLKEIGFMSGIVGAAAAAVSAMLAGFLIKRAGRNRSLVILAAFTTFAGLYLWLISKGHPGSLQVYLSICLVWAAYGSSAVIMYTTSMDMVRTGAAGTDFTMQIVIIYLSAMLISIFSGKVADTIGYRGLFGAEAILGLITVFVSLYSVTGKPKGVADI